MDKIFWTTILWIITLIWLVGFALPFLISASDTLMVILGIMLIIATIYIIFKRFVKVLGKYNEKNTRN